mmetsp:Transcript_19397/g.22015  ORF Transcript_19397/g.22015 Transcript_19397/m.22015 type:complete len:151 (-) Transcript_19397:1568-2020(-)
MSALQMGIESVLLVLIQFRHLFERSTWVSPQHRFENSRASGTTKLPLCLQKEEKVEEIVKVEEKSIQLDSETSSKSENGKSPLLCVWNCSRHLQTENSGKSENEEGTKSKKRRLARKERRRRNTKVETHKLNKVQFHISFCSFSSSCSYE